MGIRGTLALSLAALVVCFACATSAQAVTVLYVGDEVAAMTAPAVAKRLPGVRVVDSTGGTDSVAALAALEKAYDSQQIVVFDAGTNDDQEDQVSLGSSLPVAGAAAGDACMVVPTIHAPTSEPTEEFIAKSKEVFEFAESRPSTETPEWAGAADLDPGLLRADGISPTAAGIRARAQLIAEAVHSCLSPPTPRRPAPETVEPTAGFGPEIQAIYGEIGLDIVRFTLAMALVNAAL
ncbi:MAG TPA: hypothetical protein VFU11_10175 [Solirubrobacterales bacterium]|nr:hypothetical protein [Solirubrobacterales bacterium]